MGARELELTRFLEQAREGDEGARAEVVARVYPELRRIADARMRRERGARTLQPTALVHEAYLSLFGREEGVPADTQGFLAAASRAMQQVLVQEARRRNSLKRGDGARGVTLFELGVEEDELGLEVLALEEALSQLEAEEPQLAEIVRLRFFAGLSLAQIGVQLGSSEATVFRQWRFARAWLVQRFGGEAD